MDYSSKRPHWMPLRSATNTKISEKRVQPGTSNLYQIKLKVSVLSICLFYVQFIMSFSNVRICLIYLHSTIFLPQDNSRGLPTDTGTPDPGWLLLWLEQHRSCSTITHLKHTHAFLFFYFFLNHCTNQQKYYSFTFLPQKNSMHFDISTFLTTHLQSVAIICSWHYDFLMIKQNVRISLQADGWGCVNLLGLPYLKTERTRYVNLT